MTVVMEVDVYNISEVGKKSSSTVLVKPHKCKGIKLKMLHGSLFFANTPDIPQIIDCSSSDGLCDILFLHSIPSSRNPHQWQLTSDKERLNIDSPESCNSQRSRFWLIKNAFFSSDHRVAQWILQIFQVPFCGKKYKLRLGSILASASAARSSLGWAGYFCSTVKALIRMLSYTFV